MKRGVFCAAVFLVAVAAGRSGTAGSSAPAPPQGFQSNAAFAASYAGHGVSNVSATTQRRSCYRPEVAYFDGLDPSQGYPGGGGSLCTAALPPTAPFTGENTGPYDTQDAAGAANPVMLVKDHSESDIRVDPTNPMHVIGQSKWFVNAEGYNHLLGFYESWDGGATWSTQGHIPGYEGWTDNTDPVGAFDFYGNFYSLLLPYNFYYDKSGGHHFDNGSNQVNPNMPPEAVAVSVRPHGATGPNDWITKHNGRPDYVMTAKNANTSDPDKQWIAIDTNPASPCFQTVYAMYTVFVFNPSSVFVSTAHANADGTHTDWTAPQTLPTRSGKPWDSYVLPHVAPDGTVYTTLTNGPPKQGFSTSDIDLIYSKDCGKTWQGPLPVVKGISVPTYQNTTFREGILNTFAVGYHKVGSDALGDVYPLYVAYEDGSSGVSDIWLTASYDRGQTWTTPLLVNDNTDAVDELQPNLAADPGSGKVAVAFYDRRLNCPPSSGDDAAKAGLQYDPNHPDATTSNYCVNTAIQFYDWQLHPLGQNIRASGHTWDPQLNAPHTGCITCQTTFIGDYFGVESNGVPSSQTPGSAIFTTSVSTYDYGSNPTNYQQQIVSRVPIP
jgi:hypothetical protein